jgi:hypothetical protein
MPDTRLVEVRGRLKAKQDELKTLLDSARTATGGLDPQETLKMSSVAFAEKCRAINAELEAIGTDMDAHVEIQKSATAASEFKLRTATDLHPDGEALPEKKAFNPFVGSKLVRTAEYKAWKASGSSVQQFPVMEIPNIGIKELLIAKAASQMPFGVKTLFETSAGWDIEAFRSGLVVMDAQRPPQVTQLFPVIPTTRDTHKYMEESTFTNNAAEIAEGTTAGEAALALTERSNEIENLAVFIPVTEQQLADDAGAESYLNQRLPFMLLQKLDEELIDGTGSTPAIFGVANASGLQTQARSTDPDMDAIHKAITKVNVTGRAQANAIILHSNNWQFIRLLRTNDGVYILGNPSEAGPLRLWGLPVIPAEGGVSAGTGFVGDFANYSLLVERQGVQVETGWTDYQFQRYEKTIRANIRVGSVFTRGEAFCSITSLQS